MIFLEHPVHHGAPHDREHLELPAPLLAPAAVDPDVASYFLACARSGCFTQAARSLNIKTTLLRKRLADVRGVIVSKAVDEVKTYGAFEPLAPVRIAAAFEEAGQ